jgi:hypothetical protein
MTTAAYPRPVRIGTGQTYAIELSPGIYRLMVKRSALTGRWLPRG